MEYRRYIPLAVLALTAVVFQLIASAVEREYYLTQLTMAAYYTVVILGLAVLMGYAGQISIGHAAFFAIGGYTTAVLTSRNIAEAADWFASLVRLLGLDAVSKNAYGQEVHHLSPWAALAIAIALTVAVALVVGIPILKLKGHYLAMATLGFGIIVHRIVLGSPLFGEADGISDIPPFRLGGGMAVCGDPSLRVQNFYIAAVIVILGTIILLNLVDSRVGRALRAIHGNEEAASAMGVPTGRYKLIVFVLSAVYACVAGVFLTHFNGGIGPSEAEVMKSVNYVAIVAVGGMANIWGSLAMGMILNYLSLRGYFGSFDEFVFGGILIVIMMFFPQGLLRVEHVRAVAGLARRLFRMRKAG